MEHSDTKKTCFRYNSVGVSKIGGRKEQQDAEGSWHSDTADLAVVADGAGGHKGGAAASATAVNTLKGVWERELSAGVPAEKAAEILTDALKQAHQAILDQGNGNAELCGKSAIVVVYLHGGQYTVLNAGDCRAYISTPEGWKQLTRDDSLLQLELEQGMVSPEEAIDHPDQSVLTQALGGHSVPKPHVVQGEYTAENDFLLCCDGLWNQLPPGWHNTPWHTEMTAEDHADMLNAKADQAVEAKGAKSDNVSAIWLFNAGKKKSATVSPLVIGSIAGAVLLLGAAATAAWFLLCQNSCSLLQEPSLAEPTAPTVADTVTMSDAPAEATESPTETEEPTGEATQEASEADSSGTPEEPTETPQGTPEAASEETPEQAANL